MDAYKKYVYESWGYGFSFTVGVISAIYFIYKGRFFLAALGILFSYVSLDNFFCGPRAKACGIKTNKHYIIPPFLKNKAKK